MTSTVLVTGSTTGIGLMTLRRLLDAGHQPVGHARTDRRRDDLVREIGPLPVLVADLETTEGARSLADQLAERGGVDAIVHNAAVGHREPRRRLTADGVEHVFATNVLAPYVITARAPRPRRIVWIGSATHRPKGSVHHGGDASLVDLDWSARSWDGLQAYSDSKLFLTTLAFAVARRWPRTASNVVEPGWVPTRMGGPEATDDLELAPATQTWLAIADEAGALSGEYLFHGRRQDAHPATRDREFQDQLLTACEGISGVALPR